MSAKIVKHLNFIIEMKALRTEIYTYKMGETQNLNTL